MTKAAGRTIELSVENLTYVHTEGDEEDEEEEEAQERPIQYEEMDEVARNLFSFRLDHDYTPFTSPKQSPIREPEPVDELAETLSMLEGDIIQTETPKGIRKITKKGVPALPPGKQKAVKAAEVKQPQKPPRQIKKLKEADEELEEDEDEDYEEESEENEDNDSDFELEETVKLKTPKRSQKTRSKLQLERKPLPKIPKTSTPKPALKLPPPSKPDEKSAERPAEVPQTEKKAVKKEKKPPKPIPDDFALFSTPDIIRRVGGKEPTTPESPSFPKQPAKISPESRSKSNSERGSPNQKPSAPRLSMDSKPTPKQGTEKPKPPSETGIRRISSDKGKLLPKSTPEVKDPQKNHIENPMDNTNEQVPTTEDIRSIILNENTKSFTEGTTEVNMDQSAMNLENSGLDLDQSILDNINSDMISDDILYQVAKQLVDNTDLQNVIDKSIAEGNLVLDPSLMSTGQDVLPQTIQQNSQVRILIEVFQLFFYFHWQVQETDQGFRVNKRPRLDLNCNVKCFLELD